MPSATKSGIDISKRKGIDGTTRGRNMANRTDRVSSRARRRVHRGGEEVFRPMSNPSDTRWKVFLVGTVVIGLAVTIFLYVWFMQGSSTTETISGAGLNASASVTMPLSPSPTDSTNENFGPSPTTTLVEGFAIFPTVVPVSVIP